MGSDHDRWAVEFLDHDPPEGGDDDASREDSMEPAQSGRTGWRRARIPVAAVAAIAFAGVVAGRVATEHTAAPPDRIAASGTHGSVLPTLPTPTVPFVRPLLALSRAELAAARENCPRLVPECITTGEIPTEVSGAVTGAIPAARDVVAVSDIAYRTTSGPTLAYRRVSALAGRARVDIEVRAAVTGDVPEAGTDRSGGHVVTYSRRRSGSLSVLVTVTALAGAAVPVSTVQRLAADRGLLALG